MWEHRWECITCDWLRGVIRYGDMKKLPTWYFEKCVKSSIWGLQRSDATVRLRRWSTSTLSSTRQGSFLTCGCFCVGGLITPQAFLETTRQAGHILLEGRKDWHNTGNFSPYSFRIGCRFFNVPRRYWYPRRLESLTMCRCNSKGSTFSSVILSEPWVMVRPESNSRPPTLQPDAQPTEPPVRADRLLPTGWRFSDIQSDKKGELSKPNTAVFDKGNRECWIIEKE